MDEINLLGLTLNMKRSSITVRHLHTNLADDGCCYNMTLPTYISSHPDYYASISVHI